VVNFDVPGYNSTVGMAAALVIVSGEAAKLAVATRPAPPSSE
jgi:hypothetical protein